MTCRERGALYQSFLPDRDQHAYVWKYSQAIGGRRPRHFHGEPEMNLIVRGSAMFGIGDAVVETIAGELLTFPPGQDHALLEASPDL
jgi:quercetin dioxygenase-like cupin family protein